MYPWARQSEPAPFCYISIALAFVHSCQAIIRDKKNRLGCFWSRFSSQEECRRRKCYHEKMEAIRPSTSESEQKSIEENICFVFCLTCDFYRFCRLYVLQEQIKKRVKVRLNRRQFRISLPSSKLRNTGCPVTSKQCSHRLGPNEDPWGGGGGVGSWVVGLPFESDGVRLGFARRKIQIQPLREINVVWLKEDFCVLSVATPVRPNSAIYTRKRYDEHLCHFLIGALPPPPHWTDVDYRLSRARAQRMKMYR